MSPRKRSLSGEQRRALKTLAGAGLLGVTEAVLMAHGFPAEMQVGLVRAGLATVTTETIKAGGRPIAVTRVRITDAGRKAIEG